MVRLTYMEVSPILGHLPRLGSNRHHRSHITGQKKICWARYSTCNFRWRCSNAEKTSWRSQVDVRKHIW
ncbi:hypothetical protein LSAT2_005981 [Lamellibrachia satsuma]|nr:hypothetical protein LSAT2_005981 [Lamellibrachia satsuma]